MTAIPTTPRHFLDLTDLPATELRRILDRAATLKATRDGARRGEGPLAGKVLAMVFERPSTRTRVSFDV
ncbi:MAG TPA: ornithine carbamoyltransferase, partial [Methylomirabilota bacterium]|nr:ornithine carbamoyltransferase [Methylomirabilota bacterium]